MNFPRTLISVVVLLMTVVIVILMPAKMSIFGQKTAREGYQEHQEENN